jgi:hypothetical protein
MGKTIRLHHFPTPKLHIIQEEANLSWICNMIHH